MADEGLQGAGISPRERLERIEHILERIDTKLDNKADKEMVVGLDARISRMELEGCRPSQITESNLNTFRHDATAEMEKLRVRLYNVETVQSESVLKAEDAARRIFTESVKEAQDRSLTTTQKVMLAATILWALASSILSVIALYHGPN